MSSFNQEQNIFIWLRMLFFGFWVDILKAPRLRQRTTSRHFLASLFRVLFKFLCLAQIITSEPCVTGRQPLPPLSHFFLRQKAITLPWFPSICLRWALCRGLGDPQSHIQDRCKLGQWYSKSEISNGGFLSVKPKIDYSAHSKWAHVEWEAQRSVWKAKAEWTGLEGYIKILYQYSSLVDLTDREVLAACCSNHGEPSPAVGVREMRRLLWRFEGVDQRSERTLVWYRRSQWGRDRWK